MLASAAGRQSPPNAERPSSSAPWWFSSTTGLSRSLRGQGVCGFGSLSGRFAGSSVFTRCSAGCPLQRRRIRPRLQLALAGTSCSCRSFGGCSGMCASAAQRRFGFVWLPFAAPALQPPLLNSSFAWRQLCLAPRLLPNPSLEWTATGKPPWPRGALCLSCASRPSRLSGVSPSAQTLGLTSPKDGTPRPGVSQ